MGLPESYCTAIPKFTADQRNAEGQACTQTLGEYYFSGLFPCLELSKHIQHLPHPTTGEMEEGSLTKRNGIGN